MKFFLPILHSRHTAPAVIALEEIPWERKKCVKDHWRDLEIDGEII
jgi:hypothetical protein